MKIYRYRGQIAGGHRDGAETREEIILYDPRDEGKPPTRLYVAGGLAGYLDGVGGSDLEEKYMETDYFYDESLYLRRIEIPSSDPRIPAKIIAQAGHYDGEIAVFGPRDYLDCEYPDPMDAEAWEGWLDWKCDNPEAGGEACGSRIRVIHVAGVAEQLKWPREGETIPQEYARQRDNVLSVWERIYKLITKPGNWGAYIRANEIGAVLELALDLKEDEV